MDVEPLLQGLARSDEDGVEGTCEYLREYVGGDGVHAEDEGGGNPELGEFADLYEEVCDGEAEEAPAGGEEDVGACPEFLVNGEGEAPDVASDEKSDGCSEEAYGFRSR